MTTVTTIPRAQQTKKPSRALTPMQIAELSKGPKKVSVLVGPHGDRFVGLEGASANVLAHFSPVAKVKLIDEHVTTLSIPNGTKKAIMWIYKYMRAGEKNAEGQDAFETLAVHNLVQLYTHSAFLQYQHLMDRVVARLKDIYKAALPSVDDLKTFTAFVPPMYDFAVNVLAHQMAIPWTRSYSAYMEFANADTTFDNALGAALQELLKHRVKIGEDYYARTNNRQVAFSKQYYENVGKPTVKLPVAADGKSSDPSTAMVQKGRAPAATRPKAKRPPPICYNCNEEGHLARNCTAEKKSERPVPVCYNCNKEGHLSRNCTEPRKASNGADKTGRHRQSRRAVVIDVAGNGEGLRTCDREVRQGEMTRTGLII